jgi:hypothetical protein
VSGRLIMSREAMLQVATHILDLKRTLPNEQARLVLSDCAQALERLACDLPRDRDVPVVQQPGMLAEAREVSADLGVPQRSATMLLAILMANPGLVHSVHQLSGLMGISSTSVRVFACTLRKWLADGGIADAIECRWGVGYVIDSERAAQLEADYASLKALVDQLRAAEIAPGFGSMALAGDGGAKLSQLLRMNDF